MEGDVQPSKGKEERKAARKSDEGLSGRRKDVPPQSSSSSSSKEPASSASSASDLPRYKVAFDYAASNSDELTLKKDEIVTVSPFRREFFVDPNFD